MRSDRFPRLVVACLAGALLGGCVTTIRGDQGLEGQPVDAAVSLYGPWQHAETVRGRQTYIWRRSVTAADKTSRFCELRLEIGFRNTVSRAMLDGYAPACEQFSITYKSDAK